MSETLATHRYTLAERLFGPKLTDDDIIEVELRAAREGWYDVLEAIMAAKKSKRKKRWFLVYLRDGLITVQVHVMNYDIYDEDDDPFEVDV